jgi:ParB/RepB/Spo0J family partition protein
MTEQINQIPLDFIIPHPGNRKVGGFDEGRLQELADSIKAVGVLNPATVRPFGDNWQYQLVAGERRWRATRLAGLGELPCVIRDIDDVTVLKIQTIENLQREDIHPLDEADGYQRLIEEADYDVDLLAKEVGKSISYVYQRLKLKDLIPEAREAFVEGEITAGQAILIARLQPNQQELSVEYCERDNWGNSVSVRDLKEWIKCTLMLELSSASFTKNDTELYPDAGACIDCSKRTGHQPALFPEVGSKDHCLDSDCFNIKLNLQVEKKRRDLKEKDIDFLEVASDYSYPSKLPKGVIDKWDWQECKKKDPNATQVLIVFGFSRGRVTWGTKRKSYIPEKSPQKLAAEKKQKLQEKILKTTQQKLFERFIEKTDAVIEESNELPDEFLPIIAQSFFKPIWDVYRKRICKLHNWERPPKENYKNPWERPGFREIAEKKITGLNKKELLVFLIECAFIESTEVNDYNFKPEKDILRKTALELFEIDSKAITKEVTEKLTPKKKS